MEAVEVGVGVGEQSGGSGSGWGWVGEGRGNGVEQSGDGRKRKKKGRMNIKSGGGVEWKLSYINSGIKYRLWLHTSNSMVYSNFPTTVTKLANNKTHISVSLERSIYGVEDEACATTKKQASKFKGQPLWWRS
ncbi:hypothetical protein Fmac_012273 [Flemingia macrophylla]|uniref:Uncharacterized protein n=1 Tax=Flemingia macrophylla TaxID=520843 RepID=A0ABD1MPV0_9FABA